MATDLPGGKIHTSTFGSPYDYPMMDARALRVAADRRWEEYQREKLRRLRVAWSWTNRVALVAFLALFFLLARRLRVSVDAPPLALGSTPPCTDRTLDKCPNLSFPPE